MQDTKSDKEFVQEIYDMLKDIPEEQWITKRFTNGKDACCARGHIMRLKGNPNDYSNIFDTCEIQEIYDNRINDLSSKFDNIADVNNGDSYKYNQPTPKQRVLALLNDMIEYYAVGDN